VKPAVARSIAHVRDRALTFCAGNRKLEQLVHAVEIIEQDRVPGIIVEAGVAMGGSAIVIGHAKTLGRPLRLYDVFAMMPAPGADDGPHANEVYRRFVARQSSSPTDRNYLDRVDDLAPFVVDNLRDAGLDLKRDSICLLKGDFRETLHGDEAVALAHIDCDWVESIRVCLERLTGRIPPGGIIVFDDYGSFEGCRRFLDAWIDDHPEFQVLSAEWSLVVRRYADQQKAGAARWQSSASVQGRWVARARLAAMLVPSGNSVLDLGAGGMAVGNYLLPSCRYTPSDVVKRREDCLVVNLDDMTTFPEDRFDTVLMLGVMEYLRNPAEVLARIAKTAPRLVMSYCIGTDEALAYRRAHGWINDFDEVGLRALLQRAGWTVERWLAIGIADRHMEVLIACNRSNLGSPS